MLNTGKTSELCRVGPFVLELMVLISFIKRRFGFSTEPYWFGKEYQLITRLRSQGGTGKAFTLAL